MKSRNNHQHRDQDFKRTGDAGGDLFRQTNRNVVLLQPRVNAGGVDGGDQRGENALTGQILSGNFAIGIGCGDQQESHKRQQTGHHRIELKLTTEAGANADRDKEGHHAHAEVKRQHQLFAVVLGEIKPAAGKAVGGIG